MFNLMKPAWASVFFFIFCLAGSLSAETSEYSEFYDATEWGGPIENGRGAIFHSKIDGCELSVFHAYTHSGASASVLIHTAVLDLAKVQSYSRTAFSRTRLSVSMVRGSTVRQTTSSLLKRELPAKIEGFTVPFQRHGQVLVLAETYGAPDQTHMRGRPYDELLALGATEFSIRTERTLEVPVSPFAEDMPIAVDAFVRLINSCKAGN